MCGMQSMGRERWRLTGYGADALIEGFFVATRKGAEGFVAYGEEDYCDEGEDEGGGRADVPLSEDDAEVLGVPGEEHLETVSAGEWVGIRWKLAFMLHMSFMPPSPWSMPPWPIPAWSIPL